MAGKKLSEYRVTYPLCYEPNTPGHTDPSARQGYYVTAEEPEQAARKSCNASSVLLAVIDVQPWKGDFLERPRHGYNRFVVNGIYIQKCW